MDQELQNDLKAFSLEQDLADFDQEDDKPTSGEIDLESLQQRRDSKEDGNDDETILNDIVQQAGTSFKMDGKPFDLAPHLKTTSSTALLDFILSGNVVDTEVDSQGDALLKSVGTAGTNFLGLPVDLMHTAVQSGEGLVRSGINAAGGDVSTDPEDFWLSDPTAIGGGQSIRDGLEATYDALNITPKEDNTYIDSKEELSPELRPAFQVGRVMTENLVPAAALLKAAKVGIGLSSPLVAEVAANPTKFRNVETAASGTAAGLAAFTEAIGLGDNPWAIMGAEFIGSILGGNVASGASKVGGASSAVSKSMEGLIAAVSKDAANKGAVNDILIAAKAQRDLLIERADVAQQSGDTALYDRLMADADAHTPERIMQDLETSMALGETSPVEGVNLPAGTLTDNPLLVGVQNALVSQDASFSGDVIKELNTALNQILLTSERLASAGNTAAANTLRNRYFQNLLDTRINSAQAEAKARVSELGPNVSQTEASSVAQRTLFEAKGTIRAMETYLFDRIDPSLTTDGGTIANTIESLISKRILAGETIAGGGQLDAVISNIYQQARGDGPMTVKKVRAFRSRMLAASRQAAADKDFHQAGIFDELANSAMDELKSIPYEKGGDSLDAALRFSAEMNQRFTRYFNLDAMEKASTGGTAIREEQVLESAMSGSETNRALNMGELREGAEFADKMGPRVETVKQQDFAKAYSQWATEKAVKLGQNPNDVVIPPAITRFGQSDADIGPVATNLSPSTKASGDTSRLDPRDRPDDADAFRGLADDLEAFAKEMDAQGKTAMAEQARAMAAAQGRGPAGEEYFNPATEKASPETVDEFAINEGGQIGNVPAILDDAAAVDLGPTMSAAQEDFLRGAVMKLKNTDNTIDADKLEQFMSAKENAEVLKAFPDFQAKLTGLVDAQRVADEMFKQFSAIAETGKLPDAIGEVLTSKNPVENYTKLANEAMGLPNELRDLRMATIDKLFESSKTGNNPDFFKLTAELTRPLSGRSGDQSILDVMEELGVISPEETQAIGGLIAEGLRIQKSTMDPTQIAQAVTGTGDLVTNSARIFGANFGAMFGMGEGSQLQAAAIGSAAFRKIVADLPTGNKLESMKTLMLQPRTLLGLMQKNPAIRRGVMDGLKEFFLKYGSEFKGLSKGQAVAKVAKGATVGAAKGIVSGIASRASQAPIATSSALSGNTEDNRRPTVTVDDQMEAAFQ